MFTVVGCSFHGVIVSKSGIENVRLSFQPPGREMPPLAVRLESTNWALSNTHEIIFSFPQSDEIVKK